MRAITEREFFENFMKISEELTYAEVRMLYLFITEPSISELPQQEFADKIQVHRRTINIGLKKLKTLNYIHYNVPAVEEIPLGKTIPQKEEEKAKNVIQSFFNTYYSPKTKTFIVNEDFFYFFGRSKKLDIKFRYNEIFIKKTLKEKYPDIKFYSELNETAYKDDIHYNIVSLVNSEIIRKKKDRFYRVKFEELLHKVFNNFSIEEDEALRIIKLHFPNVRFTDKGIRLKKSHTSRKLK